MHALRPRGQHHSDHNNQNYKQSLTN